MPMQKSSVPRSVLLDASSSPYDKATFAQVQFGERDFPRIFEDSMVVAFLVRQKR
jgi:hypothetical protein